LAELLPKSGRNMSLDYKLRRSLGGLGQGAELWNPLWLAPLAPGAIADLLDEPTDLEELYSESLAIWRGSKATSLTDRTLEFYTSLYLQDDILAKVDRASMMNGLEARSVFLDNDLVEYVRRLPAHLKIRGGQRKYILKRALSGLLPDDVLRRPKKGFGIPLMDWMKHQPTLSAIPGLAMDDRLALRWQDEHRHGRGDHRLFLWSWAVLAHSAVSLDPSASRFASATSDV
jgi:asparagine synthase (glutamine-hydrolysing)